MAEVKTDNPIELEEYLIDNGHVGEPEFRWWFKHTFWYHDCLNGHLKYKQIRNGRIKFGVEIPGTVEEAVSLDKKNGNTFLQDSIFN